MVCNSSQTHYFIDLRFPGKASSLAKGVGRLIVYEIEGKQSDLDSAVYDALYVEDKAKMVMQTDLALNSHHITDVAVDEKGKTSAVSVAFFEDGGIICLFLSLISGCQTATSSSKLTPHFI